MRHIGTPSARYGKFAPHVYIKRDELQNPCGETMTPANSNRLDAKEPAIRPAPRSFDFYQNVAS
ncbi:hypothetical protein CCGE531_06630 [Rhizobium sp. CCGE531]|nr:hypothetical protein CCGE531_06630 [Rhizobium sp. CCGE531]AYG72186.1 hypothetical protein CCGE532_06630 [Rhizobium sp. CCGE532]